MDASTANTLAVLQAPTLILLAVFIVVMWREIGRR